MQPQASALDCVKDPADVVTALVSDYGWNWFIGKGGKKKKQKVAPWDDIPDDSESEEGSDMAEWIMHQPSRSRSTKEQTVAQTDKPDRSKKSQVQKGNKPRSSKGLDAFASADDYMPDIEGDLAALPADVSVGEEEGTSGSRQGRSSRRTKSR